MSNLRSDKTKTELLAELLEQSSELSENRLRSLLDSAREKPASKDNLTEMTDAELDQHLEESFDRGTEGTYKLMDDALNAGFDGWAVSAQILHTAACIQHDYGTRFDDMKDTIEDAIFQAKHADEVRKQQEEETDEMVDAIHQMQAGGNKGNGKA